MKFINKLRKTKTEDIKKMPVLKYLLNENRISKQALQNKN